MNVITSFAKLAEKPFLSFKSSKAALIAATVFPADAPSVFAANSIDEDPAVNLTAFTSPADGVVFSEMVNDAFLILLSFASVALPYYQFQTCIFPL